MHKLENTSASENPDLPAWNADLLKDPHTVVDKRKRVQEMFAAIAPSYDLNNRLHSLWMDQHWRRKAVKLANLSKGDRTVDVACGTGDLTWAFDQALVAMKPTGRFQPAQVIGVDFTFEMLSVADRKHDKTGRDQIRRPVPFSPIYLQGDAQALPLPNVSFDVLSIAFGIRNVQDPAKALSEFRRVLRPGGRLIILEFSLPTNPILRTLYNFYFQQILPRTATLISGDKTGAYKYLPQSVNTFISRQKMVEMMAAAGFTRIEQFPMTFGVCVCYRGIVPDAPSSGEPS